ncbi:unnamed protein product [Peronospora farinosa]|nr:unnamed protein product [Peronospora farinosa]
MKEEVNGGDEERMAPPHPANIIKALNNDEKLVAEIDENTKNLAESAGWLEWANSLNKLTYNDFVDSGSAKLSELTSKYGEKEVLSMLAAAKNDQATGYFAERLEKIALMQNYIDTKTTEDLLKIPDSLDVTTFLASPFLKTWMNIYRQRKNKSPLPPLFQELSKYNTGPQLTEKLVVAQNNKAAEGTAKCLAMYQMLIWKEEKYSGDFVFELLEIKEEGVQMFDSPRWDAWILYMAMLDDFKGIPIPKLVKVLRKHFDDDVLKKFNKKAIKGQQNDDEALAPSKRQRKDDGQ